MTRPAGSAQIAGASHPAVLAVGGIAVVLLMLQGSGGFPFELLGPDVLLAVAGFLVTRSLLMGAQATGRMPLGAWYREQLRLRAPLLVLTLAAVLALSSLISPAPQAAQAGLDAVAGLLSVGNWWDLAATLPGQQGGPVPGLDGTAATSSLAERTVTGIDLPIVGPLDVGVLDLSRDWYADRLVDVDPLGLLWLIGLLVQFTLLWPLVLAPLRRLVGAHDERRLLVAVVPVLVAAAAAAWLFGLWRSTAGASLPELALGTHVRAAEWLFGAAAAATAVGLRDRLPTGPRWPMNVLVGLACTILAAMAVTATIFPAEWLRLGGPAGAAFATAVLLLALQVNSDGPLAQALGRGFPTELGRMAYPLLVLHLPVFWLIQAGLGAVRPAALLLVGGAVTWFLGLIVQDGLLGRLRKRARPVWTVVLVAGAVAVVLAEVVVVTMAGLATDAAGGVGGPIRAAVAPAAAGAATGPRVLVLGGSAGGDLATALVQHSTRYEVLDRSRPGCGLLPGPPAAPSTARRSAHAQLPAPTAAPCGDGVAQWRELIASDQPDLLLIDLSGDAASGQGPTPCDPEFRALYRPLLASAIESWTAGAPGRPVLVADVANVVDLSSGRCLQALISESVAAEEALVRLDVDELLCPEGRCAPPFDATPLRADAVHLNARALEALGPLLEEAVTTALEPVRSGTSGTRGGG